MTHDISYALRLSLRRPMYFGLAVTGLALAIGITSAVSAGDAASHSEDSVNEQGLHPAYGLY